jgi:UPF0755 protein
MHTQLKNWSIIFVSLVIGATLFFVVAMRPVRILEQSEIIIPVGASMSRAATLLAQEGIIRSPRLFLVYSAIIGNRTIQAGTYLFDAGSLGVGEVSRRLAQGVFGAGMLRVTFPEGITIREMSDRLGATLPDFDDEKFLELARGDEGYLFPDTYFFFTTDTAEIVYDTLRTRHNEVITSLDSLIQAQSRSVRDIIIMASLLEREANNFEEAQVIAGILWKRLSIDMPLQVDATFLYELGKGSAQLTRADLRRDTPYNTYTRRGLPAGPIGNPGEAMIRAALTPVTSPYLFYLHGRDGRIHYGRNFDEHIRNRRYL